MDLGLTGKVAIVTGASRGIGRAVALALAAEGCELAVAARDGSALDDLAGEVRRRFSRRVLPFAADLRVATAVEALTARAVAEFGRLDIVVNNAGATKRGPFFTLTDGDFED